MKFLIKWGVVFKYLTRGYRDMLIFPLWFHYKTRKKSFFGAIPVFKCPLYNPHQETKKSQFFQVQKLEYLWNRLSKLKKQTHSEILLLKVVSAIFLLVCFVCLNESTRETRKNVFYFISKALFVLEIIKF